MFQISFNNLTLASGEPLSAMSATVYWKRGILADIELVISGEKLPDLANGDDQIPFNEWCKEMDDLLFGLPFKAPPKTSIHRITEQWGRLTELIFRRQGEEVTVATAHNRKKKYHCTYQELEDGILRFKDEVRTRLLAEAPRDAVVVWWQECFIEKLEP